MMKPNLEIVSGDNNSEKKESPLLTVAVKRLEDLGGNLDKFLPKSDDGEPQAPELILFKIYLELEKPSNGKLKERWHKALRIFAKIRMDCLRLKAFDLLDKYENSSKTSSAPDISFAKAILLITEDTLSGVVEGTSRKEHKEADEMDALNDEFDRAEDD